MFNADKRSSHAWLLCICYILQCLVACQNDNADVKIEPLLSFFISFFRVNVNFSVTLMTEDISESSPDKIWALMLEHKTICFLESVLTYTLFWINLFIGKGATQHCILTVSICKIISRCNIKRLLQKHEITTWRWHVIPIIWTHSVRNELINEWTMVLQRGRSTMFKFSHQVINVSVLFTNFAQF